MSNFDGPKRRIRKIEAAMPPPSCGTCRGQSWHVVIDPDPMPESPCPTCGREVPIVHIVLHAEEPES